MYLVSIYGVSNVFFGIEKRKTSLHNLVPNEPIREGPTV